MEIPVKKNQELEVEIIDLSHEGMGIAKVEGFLVFVENALVGEKVKIRIVKVLKNFSYAIVKEYVTKSPQRVTLKDKRLLQTGIAPLAHMAYDAQLDFKQQQVSRVMEKIAKMPEVEVLPTLGMENPVGYRNKAQIPVRQVEGKLTGGFFKKNSHDLVPLEDFYIQDPVIDETLKHVLDILNRFKVKGYNEADHTGFLRHLIIKRGHYTKEIMLVLVTSKKKFFKGEDIASVIVKEIPEVVSIVQNVNERKTNVILGKENHVLFGKAYYEDQLLGNTYRISAPSFYQVNTLQAETLYQTAINYANLSKEDVVVDAYCGIGTIGLSLAKKVKHVYGVEIVPEAIEDAKVNAHHNGIKNTTFKAGRAEDVMASWQEKGIQPTVVMVDPPRKGLAESFIEATIAMNPEKIVYISCNPATMARDMAIFAEKGNYEVKKVQPVDLFPQTYHEEAVGLLVKK